MFPGIFLCNFETNTWTGSTSTAFAPSARCNPSASWTGTEMRITGGEGESADSTDRTQKVYFYNPDTNTWRVTKL